VLLKPYSEMTISRMQSLIFSKFGTESLWLGFVATFSNRKHDVTEPFDRPFNVMISCEISICLGCCESVVLKFLPW
jgi:hypothetical protein